MSNRGQKEVQKRARKGKQSMWERGRRKDEGGEREKEKETVQAETRTTTSQIWSLINLYFGNFFVSKLSCN